MGYQHLTIRDTVNKVLDKELILPALQRDYVWDEGKITLLFDSLMKGYPIGAFLFWQVEGADLSTYSFHEFVSDIDMLDKNSRGVDYAPSGRSVLAVLDGQQRITSLYVGLLGSYRSRVKSSRKENNDFPKRYLALNILHEVQSSKDDQYEFEFLSEKEISANDDSHYWYRLSNLFAEDFKKDKIFEHVMELNVHHEANKAFKAVKMVQQLYDMVFTAENVSYFTAIQKDLSEAVNIFSRINNSGRPLSGTDLMLSMASAGKREDMHMKIAEAIKQVTNATDDEIGFAPDRDFILTAMLMANEAQKISTTSNDNYKPETIEKINLNWEKVVDSITAASIYIEELGFNGKKIGKSFIHPIAYYFYKRGDLNPKQYYESTRPEAQADRVNITQWLLRAQIKGIFAYGTPATLQDIRRIMDSAMIGTEKNRFPLGALLAQSQKSLVITNEDIEDIANWKYGDTKIVPLFTVLFNETIGTFDVDHLWPQSKMSTDNKIKRAAGSIELSEAQIKFFKDYYNLLPNLQLLRRTPNRVKSTDYYDVWLEKTYPDENQRAVYIVNSCIPKDTSYSFENFEAFYKKRKELIIKRMKDYFDVRDEE